LFSALVFVEYNHGDDVCGICRYGKAHKKRKKKKWMFLMWVEDRTMLLANWSYLRGDRMDRRGSYLFLHFRRRR
jgi:hypothetical protein